MNDHNITEINAPKWLTREASLAVWHLFVLYGADL